MKTDFAGLGLAVDTPSRCLLLHPATRQPLTETDTGERAWIDLLSWDSGASQAHRHERDNRLRLLRREFTAEETEEDMCAHLAALTVGWHLVRLDGGPIPIKCTPETAVALYGIRELTWIRLQVLEHLANRGNWQAAGANSS